MSARLVLEDALRVAGTKLPDELDPVFLVPLGHRLGGTAAALAELVRQELGPDPAEPFDPTTLHRQLRETRSVLREDREEQRVEREEVASAARFHVQSLQALREVGLQEDPEAEDWQWLRTFYRTRKGGIFQITQQGAVRWVLSYADAVRWWKGPVQSRILRTLVQAPDGKRLHPALAAKGWRAPADNLLRGRAWHEHSRSHQAAWHSSGPPPKRLAHRWVSSGKEALETCARCGTWRYFSWADDAYRYVVGTQWQARFADRTSSLRRPPRCTAAKESTTITKG
jgi:hypothetical protein